MAAGPMFALVCTTRLQAVIRHADTKAAVLLTAQLTVAGLPATGGLPARELWATGPAGAVLVLALAAGYCLGTALGGWRFAGALRPRLGAQAGHGTLGLLALATGPPPPNIAADRDEDVWRLAVLLARIAVAKHRRIVAGLPWLGLSSAAAFVWSLITLWAG